jgi:hypothetical protein
MIQIEYENAKVENTLIEDIPISITIGQHTFYIEGYFEDFPKNLKENDVKYLKAKVDQLEGIVTIMMPKTTKKAEGLVKDRKRLDH